MVNKKNHIDFVGVGAEKTGSSWLFKCLLEHPQICGPEKKETIFFDTTKIIGRAERKKSDYENFGIDYYSKYFKNCSSESVKGEFTTTYLHDKKVAGILKKHFPDLKIIILLRNPVEKCFAQYIGLGNPGLFNSFEEAITKEPEFIRRSFYTEYVREYIEKFPRQNILIGIYDDLKKSPEKFIAKVYTFLGVNNEFVPENLHRKVDSEKIKIVTDVRNKFISSNKVFNKIYIFSKILKINKIIKKIFLYTTKEPKIKEKTQVYLKSLFKQDVENLEQLIGIKLDSWK